MDPPAFKDAIRNIGENSHKTALSNSSWSSIGDGRCDVCVCVSDLRTLNPQPANP